MTLLHATELAFRNMLELWSASGQHALAAQALKELVTVMLLRREHEE